MATATELAALDKMPTKNIEEEDEEKEDSTPPLPEIGSSWKVYFQPFYLTILLNKNWAIYASSFTLWYLANFIGSVAVINLYSDKDRLIPCDVTGPLADPEEASKIFDMPLVMLAIFHMIEWIRATVLLSVVCIGVNWMLFWYITIPNTVFGLIVYALVHMSYFSDDGKACSEFQENRANWLMGEIIGFWVLFFIFAFPFLGTLCLGKANADATLQKAYEDAAEESD